MPIHTLLWILGGSLIYLWCSRGNHPLFRASRKHRSGQEKQLPNLAPPPTEEPAGTRQARLQGWRQRLLRFRAFPLVKALPIIAGIIALVVLTWLWRGKSDVPAARAQSAEVAPAVPSDRVVKTAGNQPEVIFNWKDDAGVAHRAAVPRDDYLAYLAPLRDAVERDRQTAMSVGTQALADEVVPVFDQMQTRVSQYADWAFDWWTSWILLGRAFGWTWDNLREGHILTLPDRVQAQLTGAIKDRFRDLALRPDVTDPKLAAIVEHSWAAAGGALTQNCAELQTSLTGFVKRSAQRTERRDLPQGWLPDPSWEPATATFRSICISQPLGPMNPSDIQVTLQAADGTGPIDDVVLRLARPFATKLISFVVLPGIIAAVVGGFVLPLFRLLPNIISGVIIGILTGAFGAIIIGFAASASVDLLLSRTDEALNRPQFEASARKAVIAVQADFETRAISAEQRAIDDRVKALLVALAGEAPKR